MSVNRCFPQKFHSPILIARYPNQPGRSNQMPHNSSATPDQRTSIGNGSVPFVNNLGNMDPRIERGAKKAYGQYLLEQVNQG